jgi:hypothetical protein
MRFRIADGTHNFKLQFFYLNFSFPGGIAEHDLRCMYFAITFCDSTKTCIFEPVKQLTLEYGTTVFAN